MPTDADAAGADREPQDPKVIDPELLGPESWIVADASFVVAALLDSGSVGTRALGVLERARVNAPHLMQVEAMNILRRQEAREEISSFAAQLARRRLADMPIQLFPFGPFADRIWELRHNLTSYDAWYVAVAEALEAPLATLDTRLAKAPGPRCKFYVPSP